MVKVIKFCDFGEYRHQVLEKSLFNQFLKDGQVVAQNKQKCESEVSQLLVQIFLLLLLLLLSRFSRARLCATPEMAARQAPPSLGFSRQEHWSEVPFPSPMLESEK